MKIKTILFFALFVFIVSCAPQVTATPEATVTLPPVSTPTLHPDFIALQESIAASSGRFSLHADGQLYDGDTPIPGVIVMPDGKMMLTVDGDKEIVILPNGYDFDDEKGFTVKGMEYDVEIESWVEVNETFTDQYGLEVVLSDQTLENGAIVIDEILPPEKYDGNEAAQAKWLNYFDAERLGFDEGATQWVKTADGAIQLVDTSDPTKVIAEYRHIDWLERDGVVFNGENLVETDGENPLFDKCENWALKWKRGIPIELESSVDFIKSLRRETGMVHGGADMMYGTGEYLNLTSENGAIFSIDGKSAVIYIQIKSPITKGEGFVVTRDTSGNPIIFYVENMAWEGY